VTPATDEDVLHRWLRFAGHYPFNSEPWRRIAAAALKKIKELPEKERGGHYAGLLSAGIKSVSYAAGQMNPQPGQFLKLRKTEKAEETDPEFLPFREWNLMVAEAEFKHTLAEFNEEQASALD
jgi:hypothetical protein